MNQLNGQLKTTTKSSRILAYKSQVQTHISLLTQIADSVNQKFKTYFFTLNSIKKTIEIIELLFINGIGTIWFHILPTTQKYIAHDDDS